ncbi:hypothetical protein ACLOJK_002024 [Asimina triloba]
MDTDVDSHAFGVPTNYHHFEGWNWPTSSDPTSHPFSAPAVSLGENAAKAADSNLHE